jgi:four helix bundle protein
MATGFEHLKVYQFAETLADSIWPIVLGWNGFARQTIGGQLVRAADSIGANIAEGTSGSFSENCRYVRIARGSLYETRHWLRRAFSRKLLSQKQVAQLKPLVDALGPNLSAYLRSLCKMRDSSKRTKEDKEQGTRNKERSP